MEKKSIVRIQNISKTYQAENGEVEALKGINFDVKEGEFISIIGPSGCGKSTLLSIISGLESKTNGEVYIDGKVGYMLQKDNLLEWRTIYKNVLLGLEIQKALTEENKKICIELLKNMVYFMHDLRCSRNDHMLFFLTHSSSKRCKRVVFPPAPTTEMTDVFTESASDKDIRSHNSLFL